MQDDFKEYKDENNNVLGDIEDSRVRFMNVLEQEGMTDQSSK